MPTLLDGSGLAELDLATVPLDDGEVIRAAFRHDLDELLAFRSGVVVLTNTHLRFRSDGDAFRALPLEPGIELRRTEHHGLCELVVLSKGERIAAFCFTLRHQAEATVFCDAFETHVLGTARSARVVDAPEVEESGEPAPGGIPGFPLVRLLSMARPRLPSVVLGAALTLVATAIGLIPPYLTMPLVDEVLVPRQASQDVAPSYQRLALYLGALGVSAVLAWLFAWAQGFVIARVSERISADLRVRAFSHLTRLSLEYFGGKRTGDLIARISTDTEHLCSFLSDTLSDFVTDILMIVGTAVVLASIDPLLALVALGSFPPIAWLIVQVRQRLTSGFLRGGRVWSGMTSILADTIPGIRVVKAFTQERREVARFQLANQRIVEANDRVNALWTFFWPLVGFLNQAGLLVVWAVGSYQVLAHQVTVGVLTAFVAYIGRFYARVESMSRLLSVMQRASAASQRLFEILDRVPSVVDPKHPRTMGQVEGKVRFEQVSFRYGSRLVLNDVSFEVSPRTFVGIVGHTGSGKSTVANLICRFYDPNAGRITIDGADIRSFSVEEYRRHIGIVLQDAFLFFGTVADNITYGRPEAEKLQVLDATRLARAHEFVLKLPEAYDTIVGERGQTLSGGERQRLAIARALLVDPRILILDEATSAVDVRTEREIQDALDAAMKGRTTIAIAHRLTTLERADSIIVLKDGAVAEMGTRSELLEQNGEFARLYRAQDAAAPGVDDAPVPDRPTEREPLRDIAALSLERDRDGRLWAWDSGDRKRRTPVTVRRCFPLTHPDQFVCVFGDRGTELAFVEDLGKLAGGVRTLLEEELRASEFLPRIERVERLVHEANRTTWTVTTDRGSRTFSTNQEEQVRRLADGRRVVTDMDGMRYIIPSTLDQTSRALLSRFP